MYREKRTPYLCLTSDMQTSTFNIMYPIAIHFLSNKSDIFVTLIIYLIPEKIWIGLSCATYMYIYTQKHVHCDMANQVSCSTCIVPTYLFMFCKDSFISFLGVDSPCFLSVSLLSFHLSFLFSLSYFPLSCHDCLKICIISLQCCGLVFLSPFLW